MKRAYTRKMAGILALSLTLPLARAAEGPMNGTRLLETCREALKENPQNAYRAGYCMAFVDGTLRGWEAGAYVRDGSPNYCLPPTTTLGQLVSVVSKYVEDNPSALAGRAELLVITAVQKAFPCAPAEGK